AAHGANFLANELAMPFIRQHMDVVLPVCAKALQPLDGPLPRRVTYIEVALLDLGLVDEYREGAKQSALPLESQGGSICCKPCRVAQARGLDIALVVNQPTG